jgi:hypothetical protein
LAVFLDPVNLVVSTPPFPDGPVEMVRFLRELARAADRMAGELEPVAVPRRSGGAHRLAADVGSDGERL